ncbi:MAG TPA: cell division protein FtsQ/DivIB [Burkholderiaceae bacterium]|nr:cell division protein FtsQ/DivIB [Burkholderiaceae bacterium]
MWNDARLMNGLSLALLVIALLGLCSAGASWAMRQPWFALRAIVVESVDDGPLLHVNAPQLRANAVPRLRGTLFTIDLAEARRAFESAPWVRRAVVSRQFPDRLVVEIEEHVPLGVWSDGRGVNTHGELFAVNTAELETSGDLPNLAGPPGTEAIVTQRWRDFGAWFAPTGMTPESVELSSRYAWRVTLMNEAREKLVVDLGREQDARTLEQRIDRFVAHVDAVKARWGGTLKRADLRYPNGFAVQVAGVKFLQPKESNQQGR